LHPFSFTRADRILKHSEYVRLSKIGRRLYNKHFIAVVCPGRLQRNRLGITVTKKVGCAVTRNRIKRRCREFFRLNRHNITGQWDINIIAKKEAATLPSGRFFSSLQNIFDRIPG
jgi:ribonuclease P protein component